MDENQKQQDVQIMLADLARIVQLSDQNKNVDKLLQEIEPTQQKKAQPSQPSQPVVTDAFTNREQFDLRDADSMSNLELDIEPDDEDPTTPPASQTHGASPIPIGLTRDPGTPKTSEGSVSQIAFKQLPSTAYERPPSTQERLPPAYERPPTTQDSPQPAQPRFKPHQDQLLNTSDGYIIPAFTFTPQPDLRARQPQTESRTLQPQPDFRARQPQTQDAHPEHSNPVPNIQPQKPATPPRTQPQSRGQIFFDEGIDRLDEFKPPAVQFGARVTPAKVIIAKDILKIQQLIEEYNQDDVVYFTEQELMQYSVEELKEAKEMLQQKLNETEQGQFLENIILTATDTASGIFNGKRQILGTRINLQGLSMVLRSKLRAKKNIISEKSRQIQEKIGEDKMLMLDILMTAVQCGANNRRKQIETGL